MTVLANTFTTALNHLLASADWARERLQPFGDVQFRLVVGPIDLVLAITADGSVRGGDPAEPVSVTLTLPPQSLAGLLTQEGNGLPAGIRLDGNAELAEALGFVFRHLRWDAEEDLSHLVGDIAAHRISRTGRSFLAAQRRALDALRGNLVEYATEEAQLLVPRTESRELEEELRILRDALARCEKRIERVEKRRIKK